MAAGMSDTGFVPKSLSEIQDELSQGVQQAFGGTSVDLSSQSLFGQLIGIIANANADLWQGLAGIYANSYPSGASGVALDNLLAIAGTSRLPARATVTNPSPTTSSTGQTLYGLLLRGTPGTVVPAGTLLSNGASSPATFSLDNDVAIGAPNNEQQVVYFLSAPTAGSFTLTLTSPAGDVLTTPSLSWNTPGNLTRLAFSAYNASNLAVWHINLGGTATKTADIVSGGTGTYGGRTYTVSALTAVMIQNAINGVAGYQSVTVSGNTDTGFFIDWNDAVPPVLSVAGQGAPDIIQGSITDAVVQLANAAGTRPFTDVVVQSEAQSLGIQFGAHAPAQGAPSTSAAFLPLVQLANNLTRNGQQVGIDVEHRQLGSAAQAAGTATCTASGAVSVLAGQLTTIVNPISGLDSVTNQLDCLPGRDIETDAEAVARLQDSQGVAASGSMAAILARVRAVAGVTQAVGFQNTSNAAQQVLQFSSQPTQGQFSLLLNGQSTSALSYNAAAVDVQAAIQALSGYASATVRAHGDLGFLVDFKGESGRQSQSLIEVPSNTTGVTLSAYFGRGAHSVEVVVQGGAGADVAEAILETLPAGIAAYSSPTLRTTTATTAGQSLLAPATTDGIAPGQQALAAGIPVGTTVVTVNNGVVTLSRAATVSASSVPISFSYGSLLADAAGNNVDIAFSRPKTTTVWVEIDLLSDRFNEAGNQNSGLNTTSKFSQSSVAIIQQRIIALINAVPIGGLIVVSGSNSLVGSFRDQPGIVDLDVKVGRSASPTGSDNLQLNEDEAPVAESYSVSIAVS